jgi:hypothetical protein
MITSQGPISNNPPENLAKYCEITGLEHNQFIQLSPGIYVARMELTAKQCQEMCLLSKQFNGHNRKIRPVAVASYRNSINTKNFVFTGQSIIISDRWTLLDGHHRCNAAREAKENLPALVVFGVDDGQFDIIDNAVGRSLADGMELSGVGRHAWLGATISMLLTNERQGSPLEKVEGGISPRDRRQFVDQHKEEVERARDTTMLILTSGLPVAPAEMCYSLYTAFAADTEKTAQFVDRLISQEHLDATDPRMTLHKYIQEAEKKRLRKKGTAKKKEVLQAYLLCMKSFFAGQPLPKITFSRKSELPELKA